MRIIFFIYNFYTRIYRRLILLIDGILFKVMLANPKIQIGKGARSVGLPIIRLGMNAKLCIGDGFKINDGTKNNFIGRDGKCIFHLLNNAKLYIGDNVGMSSCAIVVANSVTIGNNVRIGGNVVIYDTDFHSIYIKDRILKNDPGIKTAPIDIKDNVFIGAHSILLKGVTIGTNSVIGSGSVVTRNIPENEIWAGNPARFIKKII